MNFMRRILVVVFFAEVVYYCSFSNMQSLDSYVADTGECSSTTFLGDSTYKDDGDINSTTAVYNNACYGASILDPNLTELIWIREDVLRRPVVTLVPAWTPSVNRAFKDHKRGYYFEKLNYNNISKEELREQAEGYVRAIQWNLHYYYHGCCSWSWYYSHHYAPYISDVQNFSDMNLEFDLSKPFHPFEQLLAVLPAASAECLPVPFQELMRDPTSPIIDFYPNDFDTDLNGKKNDWEAVVLIPFIKEDRLLAAIALKECMLNDEEISRNSHGPHLLFTHDPNSAIFVQSSLPGIFPDIEQCNVKLENIDMDEFRISRDQIVHGLLPGVKLDVVFPGFPTMKHIPHVAELRFADVQVFQQPTSKQSMILKILKRPEFEKNMREVAPELLDSEVHINWPILQKGLVHELWTSNKKYSKCKGEVICNDLTKDEITLYETYVRIAYEREFKRRGIEVLEQKGVALVRKAVGLQQCFEARTVVTKRMYGDLHDVIPVSMPLLVQNALEDGDYSSPLDAFPLGSKVFIASAKSKYYGYAGLIQDNRLPDAGVSYYSPLVQIFLISAGYAYLPVKVLWRALSGRSETLTVACNIPAANVCFSDLAGNYDRYALRWYSLCDLARNVGTSVDVINRITGCVFVCFDESAADVSGGQLPTNKINIGLELKFSKRNQAVPDYARRSSEGSWQYSVKALDILKKYKSRFPDVFNCLCKVGSARSYVFVGELFPKKGEKNYVDVRVAELQKFLRSVLPSVPLECARGSFADCNIINEIEKRIEMASVAARSKQRIKRLAVRPRALFRPELCKGQISPDSNVQFRLLDRVICVKKCYNAPFGKYGTVIGLNDADVGDKDKNIDVLFDEPYFGGHKMRSSTAKGARLPASSLINITHGKRSRGELPRFESRYGRTVAVSRHLKQLKMSTRQKSQQVVCSEAQNGAAYGNVQNVRTYIRKPFKASDSKQSPPKLTILGRPSQQNAALGSNLADTAAAVNLSASMNDRKNEANVQFKKRGIFNISRNRESGKGLVTSVENRLHPTNRIDNLPMNNKRRPANIVAANNGQVGGASRWSRRNYWQPTPVNHAVDSVLPEHNGTRVRRTGFRRAPPPVNNSFPPASKMSLSMENGRLTANLPDQQFEAQMSHSLSATSGHTNQTQQPESVYVNRFRRATIEQNQIINNSRSLAGEWGRPPVGCHYLHLSTTSAHAATRAAPSHNVDNQSETSGMKDVGKTCQFSTNKQSTAKIESSCAKNVMSAGIYSPPYTHSRTQKGRYHNKKSRVAANFATNM